jgi:hypothetical protein
MRTVEYKNPIGRLFKVLVPDDCTQDKYQYGIMIGPPPDLLEGLDIPEPFATRFHNQLYMRGILTYVEAVKNKTSLFSAWQAALSVDTESILEAFKKEYSNARPGKK